jgi:DNA mismatch repair protein MSH5
MFSAGIIFGSADYCEFCRIFTRISTTESVSSQLSSFATDLNQMGAMLQTHSSRSLCLIDEFGKGTSPIDGISLLAAAIKYFHKSKAKVEQRHFDHLSLLVLISVV